MTKVVQTTCGGGRMSAQWCHEALSPLLGGRALPALPPWPPSQPACSFLLQTLKIRLAKA